MRFKSPSHSNADDVPRVFSRQDAQLLVQRMREMPFLSAGEAGQNKMALHDFLNAKIYQSNAILVSSAPQARATLEPGEVSLIRDSIFDSAFLSVPPSRMHLVFPFFAKSAAPLLSIWALSSTIISSNRLQVKDIAEGVRPLAPVLSLWMENLNFSVLLFAGFGLLADRFFSSVRSKRFLSSLARNMDRAVAEALRSRARPIFPVREPETRNEPVPVSSCSS